MRITANTPRVSTPRRAPGNSQSQPTNGDTLRPGISPSEQNQIAQQLALRQAALQQKQGTGKKNGDPRGVLFADPTRINELADAQRQLQQIQDGTHPQLTEQFQAIDQQFDAALARMDKARTDEQTRIAQGRQELEAFKAETTRQLSTDFQREREQQTHHHKQAGENFKALKAAGHEQVADHLSKILKMEDELRGDDLSPADRQRKERIRQKYIDRLKASGVEYPTKTELDRLEKDGLPKGDSAQDLVNRIAFHRRAKRNIRATIPGSPQAKAAYQDEAQRAIKQREARLDERSAKVDPIYDQKVKEFETERAAKKAKAETSLRQDLLNQRRENSAFTISELSDRVRNSPALEGLPTDTKATIQGNTLTFQDKDNRTVRIELVGENVETHSDRRSKRGNGEVLESTISPEGVENRSTRYRTGGSVEQTSVEKLDLGGDGTRVTRTELGNDYGKVTVDRLSGGETVSSSTEAKRGNTVVWTRQLDHTERPDGTTEIIDTLDNIEERVKTVSTSVKDERDQRLAYNSVQTTTNDEGVKTRTTTLVDAETGRMETTYHYLNYAEEEAKKRAANQPPKDERNLAQKAVTDLGQFVGGGLRAVGDRAGWLVGAAVKNRPANLISRGLANGAEAVGAPKAVSALLGAPDRSSQVVGDIASSAVRGVGEFGAGTAEGIATAIAHPVATGVGVVKLADAVAANTPAGYVSAGVQSLVSGESVSDIRERKNEVLRAAASSVVDDFQNTRERVGLPGAITKSVLDVVGLPKAGVNLSTKAGNVARVTGHLDEVAEVARAQRHLDEIAEAADSVVPAKKVVPEPGPARLPLRPVEEAYKYEAPKGMDPDKLAFYPYMLAESMKYRASGLKDSARPIIEQDALRLEARLLIEKASQKGLVSKNSTIEPELIRMTSWLIAQELKKGGVRLSKETHDRLVPQLTTVTRLPLEADGFSDAATVIRQTGGKNGVQTDAALMMARRIVQNKPDSISGASGPIKVFNAGGSDLFIAQQAVNAMDEVAPKLGKHVEEIHFERMIRRNSFQEIGRSDRTGETLRTPESVGGTAGYMLTRDGRMASDTGRTVVIQKKPDGHSQAATQSKNELYGRGQIPDREERVGRVSGTIIHETAHLLDRELGWASEKPGSPFGQGQKTSGLARGEDFVSKYAQTDAGEDFAETVRFVVELQTHRLPDKLDGPVTPALRKKLVAASEVIGSDPSVLEVLPGWR